MGLNTPVQIIADTVDVSPAVVPFKITQDQVPCTISANLLAGTEEVNFYYSIDAGTTWVLMQVEDTPAVLTATYNLKTFYGPIMLGVLKDATDGACGVYAHVANK